MHLCRAQPKKSAQLIRFSPKPCKRHQRQIVFLCLTCSSTEPLLCEECLHDHHKHDWMLYSKFFTEDVQQLFETGISQKGEQVQNTVERIKSILHQFKNKVKKRVEEIELKLIQDLTHFQMTFPTEGGYNLQGERITQENMIEIIRIVRAQRNFYECQRLERVFNEIFTTSAENIDENFDKLEETLNDQHWEKYKKKQLDFLENSYISYFRKPEIKKDFYFSAYDKSRGITLERQKTIAMYTSEYPPLPLVTCDRYLMTDNNYVAFKILKIPKLLYIFSNSTIYLGACVYDTAEYFSFHNLKKPSHGGYLISSRGKSYHSKLPEYNQKNINFTFQEDDIISVMINHKDGVIKFEKETGRFMTKFQMQLGLQDNYMTKLRPCLMFSGQEGAEVQILNQNQLDILLKSINKLPFYSKK